MGHMKMIHSTLIVGFQMTASPMYRGIPNPPIQAIAIRTIALMLIACICYTACSWNLGEPDHAAQLTPLVPTIKLFSKKLLQFVCVCIGKCIKGRK